MNDKPVTTTEWHGWGWTDDRRPELHIGPLPGRKQLCLYLEDKSDGNVHIRVLAFFRYPRDAHAAMAAIDFLTGHRR
jgi:hypothetical protein